MKNAPLLFVFALATGCGSSVDVADSSGTGAASGSTGGASASGGDGSGAGSSSGGNGSATGGSSDGGTGSGDGGSTGTGGAGAGATGGSGSGGSPDTPIACGAEVCDPATEICCASMQGTSCIGAADVCQGATLNCTSAANCPANEVCCAQFNGMSAEATCVATCGGMGPGGGIQLCADTSECPVDTTCEMGFGGFMVCQPDGFGPP